jgi:hypothetical protein
MQPPQAERFEIDILWAQRGCAAESFTHLYSGATSLTLDGELKAVEYRMGEVPLSLLTYHQVKLCDPYQSHVSKTMVQPSNCLGEYNVWNLWSLLEEPKHEPYVRHSLREATVWVTQEPGIRQKGSLSFLYLPPWQKFFFSFFFSFFVVCVFTLLSLGQEMWEAASGQLCSLHGQGYVHLTPG